MHRILERARNRQGYAAGRQGPHHRATDPPAPTPSESTAAPDPAPSPSSRFAAPSTV